MPVSVAIPKQAMKPTHTAKRRDALALASVVVDLRITQVVNGVVGVHAVLPHGALGSGRI